jgi:predicted RND superfamily exporter protein
MVVPPVEQVVLPDVLVSLVALVVVLFVARLVLRVAWKVAVLAVVVVGALWATGTMHLLPPIPLPA